MTLEQLKYDGLLSDQFISYYVVFQHFSFISSLFAFILTFIVIFRSSTRAMGTYKYFLLNEAYWNFIFDLFLALWQAATLFPAFCAFSGSVYFRHRSVVWTRYLFALLAFASIGKAVSMTCVIMHRFVQTLHPNSRFAHLYTQTTPIHQIWIFLTCEAIIVPFFYISDAQEKSIRQQIIAKSDVMRFVYAKEPSTLCLISDDQAPWPIFVLAFIPCLFVVIMISVVLIYAHRNLRKRPLKASHQHTRWSIVSS
ncbi:hypothetical protein M3Y98_01006200 [Aphelenchoides besseyi]|nr:hypothetical protein M3Y98_01006200 [Aphelenchoides besseyi]